MVLCCPYADLYKGPWFHGAGGELSHILYGHMVLDTSSQLPHSRYKGPWLHVTEHDFPVAPFDIKVYDSMVENGTSHSELPHSRYKGLWFHGREWNFSFSVAPQSL
jgi:hypothetical protein